jgi:hypothetical protein
MTQESAELKKAVFNAQEPDWFCPLINKMCRKDCVCYAPAFVRSWKDSSNKMTGIEYDAFKQYCGNQMFFRECSHQ